LSIRKKKFKKFEDFKNMKINQLREKEVAELKKMLTEKVEKVREIRFEIATKQYKKTRDLRKEKRDIAKILTLITKKNGKKQ